MSNDNRVVTDRGVCPDLVSAEVYGHFSSWVPQPSQNQRHWSFQDSEKAALFASHVDRGEFRRLSIAQATPGVSSRVSDSRRYKLPDGTLTIRRRRACPLTKEVWYTVEVPDAIGRETFADE